MRNRAKCRLCEDVIESLVAGDYQQCGCGEIGVDGGDKEYKAFYKNIDNFLRVDDMGNEVIVKVKEKEDIGAPPTPPSREDLLKVLDEMIKDYDGKPDYYMYQQSTNFDIYSLLLFLQSLFRAS